MSEQIKDGKLEMMGINIDISQILGQKIVDQYIAQISEEDMKTVMDYISADLFSETSVYNYELNERVKKLTIKEREKDIFRGIVSAPAKEFKNLPKFQRWVTGNLANNYNCRPNFMLYRNRPQSIFVKFAVTSGVLNGVWTIDNAEEAKRLQEEKELIVVRGFMPETVHFKDLPVIATPTPAATSKFAQAQEQAVRQRSISEILADDDIDELPEQDGVFDELEAEMDQLFGNAKEKATEIIAEVKEEAVEIYDKVKEEVAEAVEDLKK